MTDSDVPLRKVMPTKREYYFQTQLKGKITKLQFTAPEIGLTIARYCPVPGNDISRTKLLRASTACAGSEPNTAEAANKHSF